MQHIIHINLKWKILTTVSSRFDRRSLKRGAAQTEEVDPLDWSVILRIKKYTYEYNLWG